MPSIPLGDYSMSADIGQRAYDLAFNYEKDYGGCAQAVLASIKDLFGAIPDEVIKAGHSMAGGGAISTKGTCGGLNGGFMVLSFFFGRPRDGFGKGHFSRSYKLSKKLQDRFIVEYGSSLCPDVQTRLMGRSFDLWSKEDYAKFDDAGAHTDKCTSVAGNVARWTAELLAAEGIAPLPGN